METKTRRKTTHPLRTARRDNALLIDAGRIPVNQMGRDEVIARINVLNNRLGPGVGASKERTRLIGRLMDISTDAEISALAEEQARKRKSAKTK